MRAVQFDFPIRRPDYTSGVPARNKSGYLTYRHFRAKSQASGPEDAVNADGGVKPQLPLETAFIALSRSLDERPQHSFQPNLSFSRTSLSAFELDPSFIEAIEHLNPRLRILHAL
jgi:hypothetical protein